MDFSWEAGCKIDNFTPRAEAAVFTPSQYGGCNTNSRPLRADPTRSKNPQYESNANSRRQQGENATSRPQQHQQYGGSKVYDRSRAVEGAHSKGPREHVSAVPIHSAQTPGPLMRDLAQKRGQPHHDTGPQCQGRTHAGNGVRKPRRTPMAKEKYQLGVIIRAPLHTEDFDQGTGKSFRGSDAEEKMQKSIVKSALGDYVHSKIRKFIVVSLLDEDQYMAVPLYTFNGDGMVRKKPAAYVSVQDHRQARIKPQGNGAVITTQMLEDHVDPYHPLSVAHTGGPVARRYGSPVVYEGRLDSASTAYVVKLWLDIMYRGTKKNC
jgi:hypothetical protein